MGEIFERVIPVRALPWTGERLTSETGGQVEIEHLHRYFIARELCRDRDVLDIAAGEGYGSALLAGVARSVTGVEIDAETVRHAEAAYQRPNLRFLQGDARKIPLLNASVDVVVSFETIEHFYEHAQFLKEIRRVLRPGGCLIISSPERDIYSPAGGTPNPHHVHELTRGEFTSLLHANFRHVELYGQRPFLGAALVPETPAHEARPTLTYERRDGRFFEGSQGLPRPIYLVAIASDEPVSGIGISLYIESSGIEAIFSRFETAGDEAKQLAIALDAAKVEAEQYRVRLVQEGEYAQRVQAELNRRDVQLADQVQRAEAAEDRATRRDKDLSEVLCAHNVLSAAVSEITSRAAAAETEVSKITSHVTAMEAAVKTLTDRAVAAEAQVQAMLTSTSWRISSPVRLARQIAAKSVRAVRHPRLAAESVARRLTPSPPSSTIEAPHQIVATSTKTFQLRRLTPADLPSDVMQIAAGGARRALLFGHVLPYPPRAGNEYRVHRLLSWLATEGYDPLLVLCPLPNETPSPADLALIAAVYPNTLVLEHDGTLHHHLSTHAGLLDDLPPPALDVSARLGEAMVPSSLAKPLELSRTFCPDVLVTLLEHLDRHFAPDLIVAEYIFQTRVFPLLRPASRKIVDTIDVFSSKAQKVEAFGVTDGLALTEEEEHWLARRADVLVAIQPDEGAAFARFVPEARVVSAGVDFPVHTEIGTPPSEPVLLLVASGNPMNVAGLRDFLAFAWPLVRRRVPTAELRVAGTIGRAFDDVPEGVSLLGTVPELDAHYAAARLVINPAPAGTGLKIKTVEALSYLRPVVGWPAGVDGLSPEARSYCHVVESWAGFASEVVALIEDDALAGRLHADRVAVARFFAPETVYASLKEALNAF